MNQKYLYVVLTRTETKPARIIRLITRKPFSHVSIASDLFLSEMYSFCRDFKNSPIPAHFNVECIDTAIFGMHKNVPSEVYRIAVTNEQFESFEHNIKHFITNRTQYRYNIMGLLPMALHIPYKFKNKFVCSVWVGFILGKSGVDHNINKHPSLIEPEDFRYLLNSEIIYKGNLKEYRKFMADKILAESQKSSIVMNLSTSKKSIAL